MSAVSSIGGRSAALLAALCAGAFAGGLFLPLSLVYFTVLTNISLQLLGVLLTLATLVALPVPLLTGRAVERYGPRICVILALALQAAGYLGLVVARQPLEIFTTSAILALGGRLYWSSIFALVAHHAESATPLPPLTGAVDEVAEVDGAGAVERWFAALNTMRTVGIVGGGLLAGVVITIGQEAGYVALAWAASACCAAAAVLVRLGAARSTPTVAARKEGSAAEPHRQGLLADRGFMALLVLNSIFACSTLSLGLALPTVVRWVLQGPGWLTSTLLVINAGAVACLGGWGGRLAARSSGWVLLRRAALLWAAAYALLAWVTVLSLPVAAVLLVVTVVVLSVAEVLHAPASAALVARVAGPTRRVRYLAVFQYSFVAAELVGPVTFTSLLGLAASAPFVLLVVVNLVALPALAGTAALLRRHTATDTSTDVSR